MKKFAVILAGNGVYDGAEIHEAVLSLLAIQKNGAEYQIFAPDIMQHHVVNHVTGQEMPEKRNVLVEAARIARGKIQALKNFNADQFDALLIPGGFGVAKNLCNYAFKGAAHEVIPEVADAIRKMVKADKPVGALCISPVMLPKILDGVEVTIGSSPGDAANIQKMGGHHVNTTHGEVIRDKKHKIFTTPCYMLDATIVQIAEGADNIVREMMRGM